MKSTYTLLLAFIFSLLIFSSCKKEVKEKIMDNHSEFEGEWWSESYFQYNSERHVMRIYSNSEAEYQGVENGGNTIVTGSALIDGNILSIGIGKKRDKKFDINEFPLQLNTVGKNWWRMILSGVTYYCNKDRFDGVIISCGDNLSFCVNNTSSDTITGMFNGTSNFKIDPGMTVCSLNCFACDVTYSDENGNSFSYIALDCDKTIDIQ